MSTCPAIGEMTVHGVPAAAFRCELDEGHGLFGIRHAYTLEWADADVELLPDAALFDPDEPFDNVVPFPERDAGKPCNVTGCVLELGHGGVHDDVGGHGV